MCESRMVHRGWEAVAMGIIAGVRRETGQVLGERPSVLDSGLVRGTLTKRR